ncbi:PAS domain-containing protein [Streptomyces sp. SID6041]|nr:PAS domain-containing protein [Streptomyces sp. SID6041]
MPHGSSLAVSLRDVTPDEDARTALARSLLRAETVLRTASEALIGVDAEGRIDLVNPAAARLLGGKAAELGGRRLLSLLSFLGYDGEPLDAEDAPPAEVLPTGRASRRSAQELRTSDGTRLTADVAVRPAPRLRRRPPTAGPSAHRGARPLQRRRAGAPRHRPGHRHGARRDAPYASSARRQRQHLRPGAALGRPGRVRLRRSARDHRRAPPADGPPPLPDSTAVGKGTREEGGHGADDRTGETVTSAPCGVRAGDALPSSGGRGAGRRCPGDAGCPLARSRSMAHQFRLCVMYGTGCDTSACARPTPRRRRGRPGVGRCARKTRTAHRERGGRPEAERHPRLIPV